MTKSNSLSRWLPAIFFVLALVYTVPVFLHLTNWGVRDWDRAMLMAAIPGDSLFGYAQFPFWNPYMGGGNIFFHHPEVLLFSPILLLYLILGPVIGLKLQIFICYGLGFWGSYKFAHKIGLSALSAAMVAIAYFGSVYFALHFAEGHIMFGDYCLLPWFLLFVIESLTKRAKIVWAAGVLALMILGNGAAVPLLYTLLFSILFFSLYAIQTGSVKPIRNALFAAAGGIGISAVKFLPMIMYIIQNSWDGAPHESIPLSALGAIFFGFDHTLFSKHFDGQVWAWQEYGAYLSPLLAVLAVIAIVQQFRKLWLWLLLLVFFLLLGLGDFGILSPWSILSHFPGFSYARCTGRAFQFVLLSGAIIGGFGIDWLSARLQQSSGSPIKAKLLWAVPMLVLATNLMLCWPVLKSAFPYAAPDVRRDPVFAQVIDKEPQVYKNFLANRGSLVTPEVSLYKPSRALVTEHDSVLTDYFLSGTAAITKRLYTPNRIEYEFDAQTNGQLAVGTGYDPGWTADDGRALTESQGLIVIPFSSGQQSVTLRYHTPWFYTGLLISLLSIICAAIWVKKYGS